MIRFPAETARGNMLGGSRTGPATAVRCMAGIVATANVGVSLRLAESDFKIGCY